MIFVTVGTHEQQFDRLIKEIDRLKEKSIIKDDVFIQTGFSNYIPKFCQYKKMISSTEMNQCIQKSSLIITHGGPSTFMRVLAKNKKVIVVPRLKKFEEHVNDHQLEFLEKTANYLAIPYIVDITELSNYINISLERCVNYKSNNVYFVKKLHDILKEII